MKIDAAILAGGKSSRMGSDKSVLEVGGRQMLARVLEAVRVVAERTFVISNTPELHAFLSVAIFPDLIKNVGPMGGIHAALTHARASHCLIVACDLPFLRAEALKKLVAGCKGSQICAAKSRRGIEPLCAIYPKSCLPAIETRIAAQNLSLMNFLQQAGVQTIDVDDPAVPLFLNVNTKADLARARKWACSRKPQHKKRQR